MTINSDGQILAFVACGVNRIIPVFSRHLLLKYSSLDLNPGVSKTLRGIFQFQVRARAPKANHRATSSPIRPIYVPRAHNLLSDLARNQFAGVLQMSAEIIQFRDYQNPRDLERMNAELENVLANGGSCETVTLLATQLPLLGPNPFYHAPESDPA